jgi:hypothetical protein
MHGEPYVVFEGCVYLQDPQKNLEMEKLNVSLLFKSLIAENQERVVAEFCPENSRFYFCQSLDRFLLCCKIDVEVID